MEDRSWDTLLSVHVSILQLTSQDSQDLTDSRNVCTFYFMILLQNCSSCIRSTEVCQYTRPEEESLSTGPVIWQLLQNLI